MTATVPQRFRSMADRIEKNDDADFGGAVVIIPPDENGSIEMLVLDSRKDVLHFWTQIKTVVDIAQNEYLTKIKQQQTWGVR